MKVQELSRRHVLFTDEGIFKTDYIEEGIKKQIEIDLNLHLIMADRYNYIIDTGLGSDQGEEIFNYIKASESGRDKEIIVINTHHHWDHIWGNHVFKDSIIISHTLCYDLTKKYWDIMISENKKLIKGRVEKCLPNITFDSELYFKEDGIKIIFTPGHSTDSISILDEKEGVLNVGDNIGDSEKSPVPWYEVTKEEYLKLLYLYNELEFKTLISGHNKVLGKAFINTIIKEMENKRQSK